MSSLLRPVIEALRSRGLDLTATTTSQQYNAVVDPPYRLPEFGRDNTLVLVIGNTKALWPHITGVWDQPRYRVDPVDTYCDEAVVQSLSAAQPAYEIRFYHEPPPRRIAIQRLAEVAGLAGVSLSHLCVHPEFGPWMALRAAVVVDSEGEPSIPIEPPCDCSEGCAPQLEAALATGELANRADLLERWKLWLAVREACPVGQIHRYSDEQILYHYTEERHET